MAAPGLHDLESLVREAMEEWQVPGLALAVVRADDPILLKTFGLRDVEAGLPVTIDTQFYLASVSKSFVAAGLGVLVDEGRLDWTKPVRDYIPEFRLYDPVATERVSVLDLLCHQSGLPRHDEIWASGDRSRDEILATLRYLEPSRDSRTSFQYSNLGYMVACVVAERIAGASWEDFTCARIMKRVGMNHFGFSHRELEQAANGARPYILTDDDAPGVYVRQRAPFWLGKVSAGGGINADISGMANYLRFYLDGGCYGGEQILSRERICHMQAPLAFNCKSEFAELSAVHYGLGLESRYYRGEHVVSHAGGLLGWGTLLLMLPDRHFGAVILSNREFSPVLDIVGWGIVDRLCGKEPTPWLERFRARRRAFMAQRPADREAQRSTRKTNAPPSRPLTEFVGDYEHPGYGRVTIEASGERLNWRYRDRSGELDHLHFDTFETPGSSMMAWRDTDHMPITFAYGRDGNINRLSAPLESAVADVVFERVCEVRDAGNF